MQPLHGTLQTGAALPRYDLPQGSRHVTFKWEFEEQGMVARGTGAARITSPDNVRLDLMLGNGLGGMAMTVIGDRVSAPAAPGLDAVIPPPPLFWAALGRLSLPPVSDTVVTVSGDTLRAQFGRPVIWQLTAIRSNIVRLDRVDGTKILESVERDPGRRARYHSASHRSLVLDIQRDQSVPSFDASIWHLP